MLLFHRISVPIECDHLTNSDLTYFGHMGDAFSFGVRSMIAAVTFFIHGVCPWAFTHSGSGQIGVLNRELSSRHDTLGQRLYGIDYEEV